MIQLHNVSKVYPPDYTGVRDISFQVEDGEFLFLCGPSGAGKTTLLRLLFRAEQATGRPDCRERTQYHALEGQGSDGVQTASGAGFSGLQADSPHDRAGERVAGRGRHRRLPPAEPEQGFQAVGRARLEGQARRVSAGPLRRGTTTCRHRPRAGQRSGAGAGGRTHGQSRSGDGRGYHAAVRADPPARDHRAYRHP